MSSRSTTWNLILDFYICIQKSFQTLHKNLENFQNIIKLNSYKITTMSDFRCILLQSMEYLILIKNTIILSKFNFASKLSFTEKSFAALGQICAHYIYSNKMVQLVLPEKHILFNHRDLFDILFPIHISLHEKVFMLTYKSVNQIKLLKCTKILGPK